MFYSQSNNINKREYFSEIKEKYLDGKSSKIKSLWYDSWESIEDSTLEDWDKLDSTREVLFRNANVEKLISKLEPSYHSIFKYRKMYNPRRDDNRTSSILDAWMKKTPLLPPSLMLTGEDFILISDGIHRINAAYCLNESKIPFVINFNDLEEYGWHLLDEIGDIEIVIKKP